MPSSTRTDLLKRWAPFVVFLALVCGVIVGADRGTLSAALGAIHSVPFFDKIGHVLLIGTLAFLLNRALAARTVAGVQLGGLLVAAAMTLEECSQAWFPNRNFDYADMAANLAGVACADILARLVLRRRVEDSAR
jgi:hypothetical protein